MTVLFYKKLRLNIIVINDEVYLTQTRKKNKLEL